MPIGRPDFIGIGAQKAATTWLFKRLSMHPDIYFPQGKEIHFWDRRETTHLPIRAYSQKFSGYQIEHIGGKTGEITPSYLQLTDKSIQQLHAYAPEVQYFVVLRNPIERAKSAAAQIVRNRKVNFGRPPPLFSKNTTEGGLYAKHLSRWLAIIPKDRIHVIDFDEIRKHPKRVLKNIATHIGVSPEVYNMIDDQLLRLATSPTPNRIITTQIQDMQLEKVYKNDIIQLQELLNRTFDWL